MVQRFNHKLLGAAACLSLLNTEAAYAERSKPGSLDGVTVFSVENHLNRGKNQVNLGYSIFPLDPYYTGFDINGAYSYFFTDNLGWEVLRYHYIFTAEKDLRRQLADESALNPKAIDRLKNVISSSLLYTIAYGKQIFLDEYYFYHRIIAILGAGRMDTIDHSNYTIVTGLRADFAIDERFSWTFEGRYHVSFGDEQDNQLAFMMGGAYNF
jgi:outer membrane beta-barrel protein